MIILRRYSHFELTRCSTIMLWVLQRSVPKMFSSVCRTWCGPGWLCSNTMFGLNGVLTHTFLEHNCPSQLFKNCSRPYCINNHISINCAALIYSISLRLWICFKTVPNKIKYTEAVILIFPKERGQGNNTLGGSGCLPNNGNGENFVTVSMLVRTLRGAIRNFKDSCCCKMQHGRVQECGKCVGGRSKNLCVCVQSYITRSAAATVTHKSVTAGASASNVGRMKSQDYTEWKTQCAHLGATWWQTGDNTLTTAFLVEFRLRRLFFLLSHFLSSLYHCTLIQTN